MDMSFGIGKAFIPIRGIGFLFNNDVRVRFKERFVVKSNVPDDAKPICDDAEFKGITKMSVDVHLLDGGICSSMGRNRAIGGFIRVTESIQPIRFFEGSQLFDNTVGVFRIVFCNPSLNARGVKEQHRRFLFINTLAYRFGQTNKMVEHGL